MSSYFFYFGVADSEVALDEDTRPRQPVGDYTLTLAGLQHFLAR